MHFFVISVQFELATTVVLFLPFLAGGYNYMMNIVCLEGGKIEVTDYETPCMFYYW